MAPLLLEAENLTVRFPVGSGAYKLVLDDVSLALGSAESVGIIGESGSGKSTLTRALIGLTSLHSGSIRLEGEVVADGAHRRRNLAFAHAVQYVFQDPASALNPRMRNWVVATEAAALIVGFAGRAARRRAAEALFETVGLPAAALDARPHMLSGGQRQRLAIARALGVKPRLLILDEPTSALDVSVQARILNRLLALNREGLALLLISHDLDVVAHLCTRIAVLHEGRIVESGLRDQILERPVTPYARELIAASGRSATRR